jgi:hypothetical protein
LTRVQRAGVVTVQEHLQRETDARVDMDAGKSFRVLDLVLTEDDSDKYVGLLGVEAA